MKISGLTKLCLGFGVALSLSACMDVGVDVEILSDTEATATLVTSLDRDMYEVMASQNETLPEEERFCFGGEIIDEGDTIDCVVTQTGAFADLKFGEEDISVTITPLGNGQVRVSLPMEQVAEKVEGDGSDTAEDIEMKAMMTSMFEGKFFSIAFHGGKVIDTNMLIDEEEGFAYFAIEFSELFAGDADLPIELYAVIQK